MKLSVYGIIRILIGMLLVMQGYSEGIGWEGFFIKIKIHSLIKNTINLTFIKYITFLIPFLKFILGSMITLGVFYILFLSVALFLLGLGFLDYALFHIIIAAITYILYMKRGYNRYAMDEKLSL